MHDPRVAIIDNAPTAPHVHLCPARGHEGPLEYACEAPRCRFDIVGLICPVCEGPTQRANHPHPKVRWSPPSQPAQRVLPYQ
jgi:hypothetical protein